jgi:regulator of sigma E protease
MVHGILDLATSLAASVAAFIVVLGVVVFVHEFGHFQAGRWCRVPVQSFSLGMGDALISRKDRHGTTWKISRLPIGGFVSWVGDADISSTAPVDVDPAALARAREQGLYFARSPMVRAFIAVSGPLSNIVFAIVAFATLVMIVGHDVTPIDKLPPRVDRIEKGSAADAAGVKLGDVIASVDGRAISSLADLKAAVAPHPGRTLRIVVRRADQSVALVATPKPMKEVDETGVETTRGVLGVAPVPTASERRLEHPGPVEALGLGARQTWTIVSSTGAYIGNIFTGRASANQISGPLGIFQMSGQVAKNAVQDGAWPERLGNLCVSLLTWAALLSVAVGIVNLLPVPVLDGGTLLFCAIEAVQGRPLGSKAQEFGFRAGLALVASLFLFATWNDLQRLNLLEFLRGMLS